MASLVSKRKLRSQGPASPLVKEDAVTEADGPIPEVIVAGDDTDSDPEISTDGEDNNEDGASMSGDEEDEDDEDEESGSEDEEDVDSQGLVSGLPTPGCIFSLQQG